MREGRQIVIFRGTRAEPRACRTQPGVRAGGADPPARGSGGDRLGHCWVAGRSISALAPSTSESQTDPD
jgi:hypothetical protein